MWFSFRRKVLRFRLELAFPSNHLGLVTQADNEPRRFVDKATDKDPQESNQQQWHDRAVIVKPYILGTHA